jgi:hypothetical protein
MVLVGLAAVALWVTGLAPVALDPAGATVTPGAFTALLDCVETDMVRGTGVVTVTDPDTRQTIVDASLFVRGDEEGDEWIPVEDEDKVVGPSENPVDFTYSATLTHDVAYLSLLDARLVNGDDPEPEDQADILAEWTDIIVRAAQSCGDGVEATFSAVTRPCTMPGMLSGTVTITDPFDVALGLVMISGSTVVEAVLDGPDDDTWEWMVDFGTTRLGSTVAYELTADDPTVHRIATGTLDVPSCLGQRIFGQDAIDTSIAISKASFPAANSAAVVVLARSDFFSDALAGGPLAAYLGGPMLITPGGSGNTSIDPRVLDEIVRVLDPEAEDPRVVVLGGPLAISPGVVDDIEAEDIDTDRVFGDNLYATAVEIADELGNPGVIFEATGLNFADALSAVPAAIAEGAAILLTNGSTQAPETAAYLSAHQGVIRYAIGGPLAAFGADPTAIPVFGQDLYGTSAAVADEFFDNPAVIGVATGTTFPDALGGGVFMATGGRSGPMLLVKPTLPIPAPIGDYILALSDVQVAWVFGGPLAIDNAVVGGIILLAA